ncbi:MAG: DUF2155 domain-containing protein [Rhodospirillaceae bacterium]|nr:DUF2155 domain-containing protein [Rhodospirillaceae bacterium]
MNIPALLGAGVARLLVAVSLSIALAAGPAGAQQTRPVDPETTQDEPPEEPFEPDLQEVVLQGLDKETARILSFGGRVGETVRFRTLDIAIRRCQRTPPDEPPERAAFLQIYDVDPDTGKRTMAFSGWMFKSKPALSAMDHPIYDVWVKDCK